MAINSDFHPIRTRPEDFQLPATTEELRDRIAKEIVGDCESMRQVYRKTCKMSEVSYVSAFDHFSTICPNFEDLTLNYVEKFEAENPDSYSASDFNRGWTLLIQRRFIQPLSVKLMKMTSKILSNFETQNQNKDYRLIDSSWLMGVADEIQLLMERIKPYTFYDGEIRRKINLLSLVKKPEDFEKLMMDVTNLDPKAIEEMLKNLSKPNAPDQPYEIFKFEESYYSCQIKPFVKEDANKKQIVGQVSFKKMSPLVHSYFAACEYILKATGSFSKEIFYNLGTLTLMLKHYNMAISGKSVDEIRATKLEGADFKRDEYNLKLEAVIEKLESIANIGFELHNYSYESNLATCANSKFRLQFEGSTCILGSDFMSKLPEAKRFSRYSLIKSGFLEYNRVCKEFWENCVKEVLTQRKKLRLGEKLAILDFKIHETEQRLGLMTCLSPDLAIKDITTHKIWNLKFDSPHPSNYDSTVKVIGRFTKEQYESRLKRLTSQSDPEQKIANQELFKTLGFDPVNHIVVEIVASGIVYTVAYTTKLVILDSPQNISDANEVLSGVGMKLIDPSQDFAVVSMNRYRSPWNIPEATTIAKINTFQTQIKQAFDLRRDYTIEKLDKFKIWLYAYNRQVEDYNKSLAQKSAGTPETALGFVESQKPDNAITPPQPKQKIKTRGKGKTRKMPEAAKTPPKQSEEPKTIIDDKIAFSTFQTLMSESSIYKLSWNDVVRCLSALGFEIKPCTGSIYKFKYLKKDVSADIDEFDEDNYDDNSTDTNVSKNFHKPHDKGQNEKTPLSTSKLKRFKALLVKAGFTLKNVILKTNRS